MNSAVQKMADLGKINHLNQFDFFDLLEELPDSLSLEEAESLFGIFRDDDYDDYSAFAWEIMYLLEKVPGIHDSKKLRESKSYWMMILRNWHSTTYNLEPSASASLRVRVARFFRWCKFLWKR